MTDSSLPSASDDSSHRASILLVDDNEANLAALEAILSDFNQELVRATSGPEALRLLFDQDFAVILLDVRMPDMDGFETAELIRKRNRSRHTPIILITAAGVTPEQIARGYSVGAVDYIFKPFIAEVLKAKVGIFLDLFKKSQEIQRNEARFRTLISNIPGAVYRREANRPWHMLFLSESMEELSGYASSDFVGHQREFSSIIHAEDEPAYSRLLSEVTRDRIPYMLEYRVIHRDGRIRWVSDRGQCIPASEAEPAHLDGVLFDVTGRKNAEEALRELLGRMLQIQDDERKQIARELHDNTSPLLTSLIGKLYKLKHRAGEVDPMSWKFLDDSLKLAEETGNVIRSVSYLLHPRGLDDRGLLSALRWYLTGFTSRTGINVAMTFPEELPKLPAGAEIALFRVVQESLSSLLRHSVRAETRVRLYPNGRSLTLEVGNRAAPSVPGLSGSNAGTSEMIEIGVAAMRERIRQLGGKLEIVADASGTTVTATLPLETTQKASVAETGD